MVDQEARGEEKPEVKPLSSWDDVESSHPNLVYRTRLDGRFLIEVQQNNPPTIEHLKPDSPPLSYEATLHIFDHREEDKLLHSEVVGLSYGAIFGPDVSDVAEWQEKAINFVDNIFSKQQS